VNVRPSANRTVTRACDSGAAGVEGGVGPQRHPRQKRLHGGVPDVLHVERSDIEPAIHERGGRAERHAELGFQAGRWATDE
jgi:hypothetical protein